MKSPREYIKEIAINQPNIDHIAETKSINGSLLIELEVAFAKHSRDEVIKALTEAANKIGYRETQYGQHKETIVSLIPKTHKRT